ncbi:hypothetical protein C9890_0544 [Perkinsus sp. BL_2016]|nr:hypothetical protein C9890_0544 [Perkinsus sp. BL_2016]
MSLNLENLIAAFDKDAGSAAEQVLKQFQKYLLTVSIKQGTGLSQVVLRSSASARKTVEDELKRKAVTGPAIIRSLARKVKSAKSEDLGGPFLLHYALDVLLFPTEPNRITPGDFAGLFKSLTTAEFSSIVAPALTRALRRAASKSISHVTGILECCDVDMSECYSDIVSALLDNVNTSELTELIGRSVAAIFRQCQKRDATVDIIKRVSASFPRFGQQSVDVTASTVLTHMCQCKGAVESTVADAILTSAVVAGLEKQLRAAPADETRCRIVSALGAAAAVTIGHAGSERILREDLVSVLNDKKTSEPLKLSILSAIEGIAQKDLQFKHIKSSLVPLDVVSPFLGLLSQGRLTARTLCLSAWSVALHCAIASPEVDKKLVAAFSAAVSDDSTFCPLPGEDSPLNRRLLRSVHEHALKLWRHLPLVSPSEMETISFGEFSIENKMKNRFCVNLLKTIAITSSFSFVIPTDLSREIANRLSLALYELVAGRSVPGYLARVALDRLLTVAGLMDPDWSALVFVLAQHDLFTSRRMSADSVWLKLKSKHSGFLNQMTSHPSQALVGLVLQGSHLERTTSPFQRACLRAISRLESDGERIAQIALTRITPAAVAATEAELGVYFCPDKVVWREDTEDWIPSPETTLKLEVVPSKKDAVVKKGGVTREDMMRQMLKEQEIARKRVDEIANSNRFFIDVVAACLDKTESVAALVTARMPDFLILVKSALTMESAKELSRKISNLLFPVIREDFGDLLYAVAINRADLIDEERWTSFFSSLLIEQFTMVQAQFVWPIFDLTISFKPDTAMESLDALANLLEASSPFSVKAILSSLRIAGSNYPGPLAAKIGKVLRLVAPLVTTCDDAKLFSAISVTDEPKLLPEVIGSIHGIRPDIITDCREISALVIMGSLMESGNSTQDLIGLVDLESGPVAALTEFLKTEPLVQRLAAEALAFLCKQATSTVDDVARILAICETEFVQSLNQMGFAMALGAISKVPVCNSEQFLSDLIRFVISVAMEHPALTVSVRDQLLQGLEEALTANGQSHAVSLLSFTESFIGMTTTEASGLTVPVVLGLLSKFLPAGDDRVQSVRTKLVAELLTSELSVQSKIAAVLPPLLKMSDDVPKYLDTFLNTALATQDARARYGAALGVGAAVKAQGVAILRQMEVLKRLQEATEDSKNSEKRQGAIAVYGGLSLALGRLFEPYVAQILPVLLVAFGDGNAAVRDSSNLAASQIMANLSTHGIKLVLPSLLNGVQDLQWRTKLGSIKLLSAMLRCAPKQLGACLPKVVPALSEVATDTHSKVREAACASLSEVTVIIVNPEIKACCHKLIAALTDPANDSLRQDALDVLLSTSFVHSLDAASLALVVPVMLRATRERRSEIKRKGAQILGSIAVLSADPVEGLGPYMDKIVPALQDVLVDPIPDVRATAAKAMGTMARALPNVIVSEVLPWLFTTLKEAESQVERSGAAHGLSEVLVELGPEQFIKILPEVVSNAANPNTNPEAREGYLGLFVFLPTVMRAAFVPHIETVFPVLVNGLSDSVQSVREVAFRAATSLCSQFGATHAALLMPSLERGLFAKDWRARQASIHLTGETLEVLMKSSRGGNRDNLLESQVPLTQEKRSYMLAMLYIVRSDVNPTVNQNAQSIWKRVVANTPRTLRLILPILVRLLIANLSSSEEETRQVLAARCLGDLVGKLGERVLPDLMPILIENASSPDPMVRAGVCVGLSEIVHAANRQLLQEYFSIMFPAMRNLLCDESPQVRSRAGATVGVLYIALGNTTVNSLVPQIIEQVQTENESAIEGLGQLVQVLGRELLLMVIDALATEPPTGGKLRGLEKVSAAPPLEVAKHVTRIVGYLMSAYKSCPAEALHAGNELFGHLNRHSCHLALIELLRGLGDSTNEVLREACANLIASCTKFAPLEVVAEYMDSLIPMLIRGTLSDPYQPAMEACLLALGELITKFTKESMVKYIREIAGTVENAESASGLALPRTFETLWPVYQQALMFGSNEAREIAATGLVVLVQQTPTERLKPNAIKITGPLIRVLGDNIEAIPSSAPNNLPEVCTGPRFRREATGRGIPNPPRQIERSPRSERAIDLDIYIRNACGESCRSYGIPADTLLGIVAGIEFGVAEGNSFDSNGTTERDLLDKTEPVHNE